MTKRRPPNRIRAQLGRAVVPAVAVGLMLFFGAYAVLGPNGVLALGDYRRQIAAHDRQLAALSAKRETLKNRVALLDPRHANPDMVDELVRKELNVAHPDEVIVPLK